MDGPGPGRTPRRAGPTESAGSRRLAAAFVASLLLVALGCGSDEGASPGGVGAPCTSGADCESSLSCLDGRCAARADGGDAGPDGGGVDAGPSCPPIERCGGACCAASEECVGGECLPACASGLRCGAESECCAAGDLCISGACVTPGAECTEAIDCELEWDCDPELGRCLPRGPERCEYFPPPGVFEPEEQWAWTGSTVAPESVHVLAAPAVGDLTGDGVPEVVFATYSAVPSGPGVLRAVRGDTGEELFGVTDPVICPVAGIALGDLDGDGSPEIVTGGPCNSDMGRVLAFRSDGTLAWSSRRSDGAGFFVDMFVGATGIADLDGDGLAEVVVGGTVLGHDGALRWSHPTAVRDFYTPIHAPITAVYDVDADGALEVVAANVVWEADGTTLWEDAAAEDGHVAVADFFEDDLPDIVVVHDGHVSIRRGNDGTRLWGPVALPGGGCGGPPTVADFDGDGLPEIGVAGAAAYVVLDPDGDADVLWSQPTQDASSANTGSSVFDFDGDGRAEVVYNDECYMRVYAGIDGAVLAEVPQSSATAIEYPTIVDVDADGNAEIVFAGNAVVDLCGHIPGYTGRRAGIRVFRDGADNWVGTRRVWNQHTYHITNVREDLSIPRAEQPNWRRFNNFRQNPQSFDAPNLVGVSVASDPSGCPPEMGLSATIDNRGAVSVGPGLAVSFYLGIPEVPGRLLGTVRTTAPLVPGGTTTVTLAFEPAEDERGAQLFFVRADDTGDGTGEHNECVEDDNTADGGYECEVIE